MYNRKTVTCNEDNVIKEPLKKFVEKCYRDDDLNCAITTVKYLSDKFGIEVNEQVYSASVGLNGAGQFGAQCGLLEGALIFIGILGTEKGYDKEKIMTLCREFTAEFENIFKSLLCSEIRPEGFTDDNPPHLCEPRTIESIELATKFIELKFKQ